MVRMTVKDQLVLDTANRVLRGEITLSQGAEMIGKSYRQTRRIVAKVRQMGILGVVHGNRGKSPWNKTQKEFQDRVMGLLREQYWDFNLAHFRERLLEDHGIIVKRETLRNWAKAEYLIKRAHKIKKRKAHRCRERLPRSGMMLQFDGSSHLWLGRSGTECSLLGGIDDATSYCPYAEFFDSENTASVLTALRRTVETAGVPEILYVDQASHFGKTNGNRIDWSIHLTHVERAMSELGCRVLFAHSPQAKGKIERMWGTFQDRLIPEMRMAGIRTMSEANTYLQQKYIPSHNLKFAQPPRENVSAYRVLTEAERDRLDWIFCLRDHRKIASGEIVSFGNQPYLVEHDFHSSLKGAIVEIRTTLSGVQRAFFAGRPIELKALGPNCNVKKRAA
jgi:hypothetical protein